MKTNIALFGFGCVGQGFYEIASKNDQLNIKHICVKRADKERSVESNLLTTDPNTIWNDKEVDLIVELIDNAEEALEYLRLSLNRGTAYITANKKMVAENLEEIIDLQHQFKTAVYYEGAVAGSIPIIQSIRNHHKYGDTTRIRGIVNGSCNYILSKMYQSGSDFNEALKEAQALGFAESDPTLDVEGLDSAFKLSILIYEIFGIHISPENIETIGIDKITADDISYAKQNNLKIKLVASAEYKNNKLSALVSPTFISAEENLYHVDEVYNAIEIQNNYYGEQLLYGKGAGSLPTGLAVYADVISAIEGSGKIGQAKSKNHTNTGTEEHYCYVSDRNENFNLKASEAFFSDGGNQYYLTTLSPKEISEHKKEYSTIVFSHTSAEKVKYRDMYFNS